MKISIAKRHIEEQHPEVLVVLPEVLEKMSATRLKRGVNLLTFDMGRVVGHSACVKTTPQDEIVFAQRVGRPMKTRFTKSQTTTPTSRISVIAKHSLNHVHIVTAFAGEIAAREPGDPSLITREEIAESEKFWAEHALVWGSQVTV